jgi:hypothetical protein
MAETRDYIDHMQEEAKLRFGRELSASEVATQFALHPMDTRINHLKALRADETLTIHGAAKRLTYERALKETHHTLRRAGR